MRWMQDKWAKNSTLIKASFIIIFVVFFNDAFRAITGLALIFLFISIFSTIYGSIALAVALFFLRLLPKVNALTVDIEDKKFYIISFFLGWALLIISSHTIGIKGITAQTVFDLWSNLYNGEWHFGNMLRGFHLQSYEPKYDPYCGRC